MRTAPAFAPATHGKHEGVTQPHGLTEGLVLPLDHPAELRLRSRDPAMADGVTVTSSQGPPRLEP